MMISDSGLFLRATLYSIEGRNYTPTHEQIVEVNSMEFRISSGHWTNWVHLFVCTEVASTAWVIVPGSHALLTAVYFPGF